ncbi:MAG: SHOCT domain-containing protein [Ruminococcaceae bacterium]|nr:SHOCT domain-containing protein [Oscillospiraceae bacterium]
MDEKILIKSERYNVKKFFIIMVIIGVFLSAIMIVLSVGGNMKDYDTYHETYLKHQKAGECYSWGNNSNKCWECENIENNPSKIGFAFAFTLEYHFIYCMIPVAVLVLLGGLIYLWLRSYELTVTDKRIYGKVAWGKRVDLPVDSVSATSTINLFKGVSIATSSGRISFRMMKNAGEIYHVINDLLIERQKKEKNLSTPVIKQEIPQSNAEELKKFKELLDSGIITQEEFDAKKKQLLGL